MGGCVGARCDRQFTPSNQRMGLTSRKLEYNDRGTRLSLSQIAVHDLYFSEDTKKDNKDMGL